MPESKRSQAGGLERELLLDGAVKQAVSLVYRTVWMENDLSAAEARLAWLRIIEQLVQSAAIDRQSEVVREQMGL